MADTNFNQNDRLNQIKAGMTAQLAELDSLALEVTDETVRAEIETASKRITLAVAGLGCTAKKSVPAVEKAAAKMVEEKIDIPTMPYIPARMGKFERITCGQFRI